MTQSRRLTTLALVGLLSLGAATAEAQFVERAFLFGARELEVPIEHPTNTGLINYTPVIQSSNEIELNDPDIRYDAARGWGFEVWRPEETTCRPTTNGPIKRMTGSSVSTAPAAAVLFASTCPTPGSIAS